MSVLFLMTSPVCGGSRFEEGLRMIAAFIGMDEFPVVVFLDSAVKSLLPGSLEERLYDYLRVATDLACVYVLERSLDERGLNVKDLDGRLSFEAVKIEDLRSLISQSSVSVAF